MGNLIRYQQVELAFRVITPFLTLFVAVLNLLENSIDISPDQKIIMERVTGGMLVLIAIPATLAVEFTRNVIPQLQKLSVSLESPDEHKAEGTWMKFGKNMIPFKTFSGHVV